MTTNHNKFKKTKNVAIKCLVMGAIITSLVSAPVQATDETPGKLDKENARLEAQMLQVASKTGMFELDVLTGKADSSKFMVYAKGETASRVSLKNTVNRVEYLKQADVSYTNYDFRVSDIAWRQDKNTVVMTVTEYISLTIAGWEVDPTRPQSTEYEQTRILTFLKRSDGLVLTNDEVPFQFSRSSGPQIDDESSPKSMSSSSSYSKTDSSDFHSENGSLESSSDLMRVSAINARRDLIVGYAVKWSDPNTKSKFYRNPDYRNYGDNDCSNFVSQSMRAGGWSDLTGVYLSDSYWWYNWANQTRTWTEVNAFWRFATGQRRGTQVASVSCYCSPSNVSWKQLSAGDVMQADWDSNGSWDHNMVITTKDSKGSIYLSYHSNNRRNFPIADFVWSGFSQYRNKVSLRGLQVY